MAASAFSGRRVWVAGHAGMVGQALVRRLSGEDCRLLTVPRAELDLLRREDVEKWIARARPDVVFLAAAKVGNNADVMARPDEFLHENMAIQDNVIGAAALTGVDVLVFIASSAVYPDIAGRMVREDDLPDRPPTRVNGAYARAKIAGIKLCRTIAREQGRRFTAAVPCNLYGPGDRFDADRGRVVAGMMTRMHRAKLAGEAVTEVWGDGTARRELLFVDDLAEALARIAAQPTTDLVNVGPGQDVSIAELAEAIRVAVGFAGRIRFNPDRPQGSAAKILDSTRLRAMGWRPTVDLGDGLKRTYDWFLKQAA